MGSLHVLTFITFIRANKLETRSLQRVLMESSPSSDQNDVSASETPTSSVSSPYRRTYSDISGLSHRFDVQSFYNRPSNTNAVVHEEDLSEDAVEPKDNVDGDGEDHDRDSDIDSAEDAGELFRM